MRQDSWSSTTCCARSHLCWSPEPDSLPTVSLQQSPCLPSCSSCHTGSCAENRASRGVTCPHVVRGCRRSTYQGSAWITPDYTRNRHHTLDLYATAQEYPPSAKWGSVWFHMESHVAPAATLSKRTIKSGRHRAVESGPSGYSLGRRRRGTENLRNSIGDGRLEADTRPDPMKTSEIVHECGVKRAGFLDIGIRNTVEFL